MPSDLARLRADYDAQAGRSLSLPIAGALVWGGAGVVGLFLSTLPATIVLVVGQTRLFLSRWPYRAGSMNVCCRTPAPSRR